MKLMRFLLVILFIFSTTGFQKNLVSFFMSQASNLHVHQDSQILLTDLVEYIFTGHIEHSHSHHDEDADSNNHEHSHHHVSTLSPTVGDFMTETFQFHNSLVKLSWPVKAQLVLFKSFQSEILRPPINT